MVNLELTQYDIEHYLLILIRLASFLVTAPIFSMASTTPTRVKIAFAAVLSFLVFPMVPSETVIYDTIWQYTAVILKETVVGLVIGFMANICMSILGFSGRIVDTEIGFAMVSQYDPTTRDQISITGTIYTYFVIALLIVTDMYQYVVRAIIDSYQLIPIGGAQIQPSQLMSLVLQYITDSFIIGFRIILPFFAATLIVNVVLGVLAKVAPQMNMFVIGMQLKVLMGLIIMLITAPLLNSVANFVFNEIKTMVVAAIQSMS